DRRLVLTLLRGVGEALAHARPGFVAAALALHVIGLVITGERWRLVIAALGYRLPLVRGILINLAGIFVRHATPTTRLGRDPRRLLLRGEGVPFAQAAAAFAYVRLAEIPPIALIVMISAPAVTVLVRRSPRAIAIASALAAVAALVLWLKRGWLRRRLAAVAED